MLEFFENLVQVFRCNADAGILDGEGNPLAFHFADHLDAALAGEFGGIAQQVEQHLADLFLVRVHLGQVRRQRTEQPHTGFCQRLAGGQATVDQRGEAEIADLQLHASGFDLGDIQNGVDQAKQMLGADQYFVQILKLLFGKGFFTLAPDDAGETDDGVQRRAELVAHIGQEGRLGLIGFFGGAARLLDF